MQRNPTPDFPLPLEKHLAPSRCPCKIHPLYNGISCGNFAVTAVIAVLNNMLPALDALFQHQYELHSNERKEKATPALSDSKNNPPPLDQTISLLTETPSHTFDGENTGPWILSLCSKNNVPGLQEWEDYFITLHNQLITFQPAFENPLAFILQNSQDSMHSIILGWDPQKQHWIFIDKGELHTSTGQPIRFFSFGDETTLAQAASLALAGDNAVCIFAIALFAKKCDLKNAADYMDQYLEEQEFSVETIQLSTLSGSSLLHAAVRHNLDADVAAIFEILHDRPEVIINLKDKMQNTPLHLAARRCTDDSIVDILLKAKANPTEKNNENKTPLVLALENNAMLMVKQLIKANVQPLSEIIQLMKATNRIDSEDEIEEVPLHWAAREGHLELATQLLDAGADTTLGTMNDEETPLFLAAENNHAQVVQRLVEKKADVGQAILATVAFAGNTRAPKFYRMIQLLLRYKKDPFSESAGQALYYALHYQDASIIQRLLRHNVKPDWAICEAARRGDEKVTTLLLKTYKANANSRLLEGNFSALYLAAQSGHLPIVKQLLEHKALLHLAVVEAAAKGDKKTTEWLLNNKGDVNSRDEKTDCTALYNAAQNGHDAIVELLLQQDAQIDALNEHWKASALYTACKRGHAAVFKRLLNAMREKGLPIVSDDHYTPLHSAAYHGRLSIVKLLLDEAPEYKWDVNASSHLPAYSNTMAYTPLYSAAAQGHASVVELLLNANADPNKLIKTYDSDLKTPLCGAAEGGHLAIVNLLLQHKAVIYKKDKKEDELSALVLAAERNHADIVKILLPKAEEEITSFIKEDCREAFDAAVKCNQLSVVRVLLEHPINIDFSSSDRSMWLGYALTHYSENVVQELLAAEMKKDETSAKTIYLSTWSTAYSNLMDSYYDRGLSLINLLLDFPMRREIAQEDQLAVLRYALDKGHEDIVNKLLSIEEEEKSFTQEKYLTAFQGALTCGHTSLAITMLDHPIVTQLLEEYQLQMIPYAVALGHTTVIPKWLSTGQQETNSFTQQKYITAIQSALAHNNTSLITLLLGHPIVAEFQDGYHSQEVQMQVLRCAVAVGHTDALQKLLPRKRPQDPFMQQKYQQAFLDAIHYDQQSILDLLLGYPAIASLPSECYLMGLKEAIEKGHASIVASLLKEIENTISLFQRQNQMLHTLAESSPPLFELFYKLPIDIYRNPMKTLEQLITEVRQLPTQVIEVTPPIEKIVTGFRLLPKPLSLISSSESTATIAPVPGEKMDICYPIIQLLGRMNFFFMTELGRSMSTVKLDFHSLLIKAINSNHELTVRVLLEHSLRHYFLTAVPSNILKFSNKDDSDKHPNVGFSSENAGYLTTSSFEEGLPLAIRLNNTGIVKAMLDYRFLVVMEVWKSKPRSCPLDLSPICCSRALLTAAHHGYTQIMQLLLKNKIMRQALNSIVDSDDEKLTLTTVGERALHAAASSGHTQILSLLLQCSVNPNVARRDHGSALVAAVYYGDAEAVRLLLNQRADASVKNGNGKSALLIAVSQRHFEIINMLMKVNSGRKKSMQIPPKRLRKEQEESSHFKVIGMLMKADMEEIASQHHNDKKGQQQTLAEEMAEDDRYYRHLILNRFIGFPAKANSAPRESHPPQKLDEPLTATVTTTSADTLTRPSEEKQTPERDGSTEEMTTTTASTLNNKPA